MKDKFIAAIDNLLKEENEKYFIKHHEEIVRYSVYRGVNAKPKEVMDVMNSVKNYIKFPTADSSAKLKQLTKILCD